MAQRLEKKRRGSHPSKQPSVDVAKKQARAAGLLYVEDDEPGISRRASGESFRYFGVRGKAVKNRRVIRRIRSLAIPPAWTDVWICASARGHLQATGRDARGRKQYLYHPDWRMARDENKYERLIAFAERLPRIRRKVAQDLRRKRLSHEKVLAAIVKLLETTLIRVGNDEYAKSNRSFGLTTMRDRHARVNGSKLRFEFRGKSGIEHEIALKDSRLAQIVRKCQDLPGQELFQYVDGDDEVHDVGSTDVNEYLHNISGLDVTAKDFRTWAGTKLAAHALKEFEEFDSEAAAKRNITRAIERVAERLGNTKAISRKCYVHPAIIDAYMDRSLVKLLKARTERELRHSLKALSGEEAAVLTLLRQRMERELKPAKSRRGRRGKPKKKVPQRS